MVAMQQWEKFVNAQEEELGAKTVEKWLRSLRILRYDSCNLYLEAKDTFQLLWFEEHVRKKVNATLVNGNQKKIKVHISLANQHKVQKKGKKTTEQPAPKPTITLTFDSLDPLCKFDHFIVVDANQLTHKLLCKISHDENDTTQYNPVYIFGGSGTGKTHLLMAAAQALKGKHQNVNYVRAETFTEHVVTAIRSAQMGLFRQTYRNSDVLLIDDVHLFAGKGATQEELFHTFNALHLAGKQIILSSNCSPAELKHIEPRLVSRFEWGIVLPLEPLNQEALQKALITKSTALEFPLPEKVVEFLLAHFGTNTKSLIRAIEALILRTHLENDHKKKNPSQALTVAMTKTLLADLLKEAQEKTLTTEQIIKRISEHFDIRAEDILGAGRTRDFVLPRHLAMYLCRKKLKLPYSQIGEVFSRDHSTVMSSIKLIQNGVENYDPEIASHYHAVLKTLS